jgi:MFS family permease
MSATILGGAALQWPIGHLSDQRDRRAVLFWVCATAALIAAGGYFASHWSHAALVALGFLYGGFAFTLYGLSVAHVNDLTDSSRLLEVTGGLLLLYGIGAAVGPAAAGVLMDALGPGSLMTYFAGLLCTTAIFAAHRMRVLPRAAVEEKSAYVGMAGSSQAVLQLDPRTEPPGPGDRRDVSR